MTRSRPLALLAAVVSLAFLASACSSASGSDESSKSSSAALDTSAELVLYNAQHEDLMQTLVDGFTKETGIKVTMKNGKDFELANQLVQEGAASPADLFVTENSPAMTLVDSKGLFAPVDKSTLANVPSQFVPSSKKWTGFAARATVVVYNKDKITKDQLPTSIMDLSKPEWQGKFGIAAGGADFQAIVSAVLAEKGTSETEKWLTGLKTNAKIYQSNGAVMKAVNAGEIEAGVIYHYYWYKDQAESKANSANTELDFLGNKDPGAFVSVSGAGVLKSSKHPKEAQKFVEYLTSKAGQTALSGSTAMEYSIASGVAANPALKPLSELDPPKLDVAKLNGSEVVELMQKVGLL